MVAVGRDDAQLHRAAELVDAARQRHKLAIEQHERRAGRQAASAIAHSLPAWPRSSRDSR